jgi:hypothetical protein
LAAKMNRLDPTALLISRRTSNVLKSHMTVKRFETRA